MQIEEYNEELWLKFQRLNKDETLPITKKEFNKNNDHSFDHGFEMGRLDVFEDLLKIGQKKLLQPSINDSRSHPGGCSPSVVDFAFLSENPNQNKENRI